MCGWCYLRTDRLTCTVKLIGVLEFFFIALTRRKLTGLFVGKKHFENIVSFLIESIIQF